MADGGIGKNNFSRFQVFSGGVPANIATYGYTPDEVQADRGKPETDVRIAPMAAPAVSGARLALVRGGSDLSRLASPSDPGFNPFEGPPKMLDMTRRVLAKLSSPAVRELVAVIEGMQGRDVANASLMQDSLRRLIAAERVERNLYDMASFVQAHQATGIS